MKNFIVFTIVGFFLTSCGTLPTQTKLDAYPAMYDDRQPLSILVIPAINKTTAADATDYFNVTITEPLSNSGYYTMPVEIIKDIFFQEGVIDSTMIKGLPTSVFRNNFGADAVLFVTINAWDKNYAVIAANVTVSMEYVMISTDTNEIIWQYSATQVIDTTAESSGFLLADLITTALTTATTDYVPIAKQVNYQAFIGLPHGKYSKIYRTDGQNLINVALKDAATASDK